MKTELPKGVRLALFLITLLILITVGLGETYPQLHINIYDVSISWDAIRESILLISHFLFGLTIIFFYKEKSHKAAGYIFLITGSLVVLVNYFV